MGASPSAFLTSRGELAAVIPNGMTPFRECPTANAVLLASCETTKAVFPATSGIRDPMGHDRNLSSARAESRPAVTHVVALDIAGADHNQGESL